MKHTLLACSLLSTAMLLADTQQPPVFKQSDPLPEGKYPAAYNAPAQVRLQNSKAEWVPDVFIDASFIYYHADEEGLDLAASGGLVSGAGGLVTV
ncbi:MAG: hypothetical protein HYX67_17210, partial [Candidatus Melainabacteria bacterium]|nr:hypothetical protein [Candidatus Melainabacteria bacterium]